MARLFGTDGIRGVANVDLTPLLATALGRAVAAQMLEPERPLLVGQDTRRSGDMLSAALIAGATSMGADVHHAGVLPTPALAFLAARGGFGAAVMVSASHNPAQDNGLKVLDERGIKLDDALEDGLEEIMARSERLPSPGNDGLGRSIPDPTLLDLYTQDRLRMARAFRSRLRVVLDCANGSGCVVGPEVLAGTGAHLTVLFATPDGRNINLGCGATAPAALAAEVPRAGGDVGFALDGDADRCVAVDEHGEVVDGDRLIGLIALDRISRGALGDGTVVVTVLSNGGLAAAIEEAGGRVVRTPVGDKHVLGAMLHSGARLGGEKSGHVIVADRALSGDGIVTALEVLEVVNRRARPLSELAAEIPLFPQQQRTVAARLKDAWGSDARFVEALRDVEAELTGRGRIIVRPSGTEPALRIMIEGQDEVRVTALADSLAALAGERLN